MKSVITIIASNPRVYYDTTIFKPDSNGPTTVSSPNTSNFPHISTNDATIVSLTEEQIIIRTLIPYISPFPENYLKRDFENDLDESYKPPRLSEILVFLRFRSYFVVISSVCFEDAIEGAMLPFSMLFVEETDSTIISS